MARDFVAEGVAHHQAGRLDEAARCYAQVARSDPAWPHAVHYRGLIALQQGDGERAVDLIKQAIERLPAIPEFYVNLGNAEKRLGRLQNAVADYDQAIALRPSFAEALANRGLALAELGRRRDAVLSLEQALTANARLTMLRLPLARLQFLLGEHAAALANFSAGLDAASPADAWVEAGISALELRQPDLARRHFERAAELDSGSYDAFNGLGAASADLGQITAAIAAFGSARRLSPASLPALENLANVLKDAGRLDEALPLYREALALPATSRSLWSNYLFASLYSDALTERDIAAAHDAFGTAAEPSPAPLGMAAGPAVHEAARRLRVGYVSADLFDHPVASFFLGLLQHHDVAHFEIFVYQTGLFADRITADLKARAEHWRECALLTDEQFAARVRQDRVDILVDLSGHTANHRLHAFAARLAPVQLSYLGYPFRTGLKQIDGRIVDLVTDPPESTDGEALIRLSRSYYGYTPPAGAPDVRPLPLLRHGRLSFGVASNLAKVSPSTLDDWSALLRAIGDSTLRWRAKAFSDPDVRQRWLGELARRGVDASRLQLEAWTTADQRWEALSAVDVALDTRPYNQATSTCEAMWMGVPTLTIAGHSHRSRMGASILAAAGLEECIGQSVDDWIGLARAWRAAPEKLAQLRAGMRRRMLDSALCDCRGLTREIESAYCATLAAAAHRPPVG